MKIRKFANRAILLIANPQIFMINPQIANLQILGLVPQFQIGEFLKFASLLSSNPQIFMIPVGKTAKKKTKAVA
jgi:hypothetical protein